MGNQMSQTDNSPYAEQIKNSTELNKSKISVGVHNIEKPTIVYNRITCGNNNYIGQPRCIATLLLPVGTTLVRSDEEIKDYGQESSWEPSNKMRVDQANVININCRSCRCPKFKYFMNQVAKTELDKKNMVCTEGIHVFTTKKEAEEYQI